MTREGDLKDIPPSVKTLGRGSILGTFRIGLCLLHSNFGLFFGICHFETVVLGMDANFSGSVPDQPLVDPGARLWSNIEINPPAPPKKNR